MSHSLHHGDCLTILKGLPSDSVALVATDPPYNTGREWRGGSGRFSDTWATRDDFVDYMRDRAVEMRRVLKPGGSLYWQCDPNISPWLRFMLNDVFGEEQYQDEIVWKRRTSNHDGNRFAHVVDYILRYGRGDINTDEIRHPVVADIHATKQDEHGAYRDNTPVLAQDWCRGDSGLPWQGFDPQKLNKHWRAPTKLPEHIRKQLPPGYYASTVRQKLDALLALEFIVFPASGAPPCAKGYESERAGMLPTTLWDDINFSATSNERVDYPTQKPVALYERIVLASSALGDTVLDPFCGSGTTGVAAVMHGRDFIGIDQSEDAMSAARTRLNEGATLL